RLPRAVCSQPLSSPATASWYRLPKRSRISASKVGSGSNQRAIIASARSGSLRLSSNQKESIPSIRAGMAPPCLRRLPSRRRSGLLPPRHHHHGLAGDHLFVAHAANRLQRDHVALRLEPRNLHPRDRKSTRLNSS